MKNTALSKTYDSAFEKYFASNDSPIEGGAHEAGLAAVYAAGYTAGRNA